MRAAHPAAEHFGERHAAGLRAQVEKGHLHGAIRFSRGGIHFGPLHELDAQGIRIGQRASFKKRAAPAFR